MNQFYRLTASQALQAGLAVTHVVTPENSYGFDKALLDAFALRDAALSAAINASTNADLAARAATQAKADARAAVIALLSRASKVALANPAVTDQMLKAIGFSPRPSHGVRPQSLPSPTDLIVQGSVDGAAKLKWSRNGAGQNTVFLVEYSNDGLSWAFLKTTTKTSYLAEDFAPGVGTWFRVTATNSTLASLPCAPATIYVTQSPEAVALKVA